MRKIILASTLIVLLAVVAVSAQVPGPGGPYNSAFTIQNLESQKATCVFSLYDSAGSKEYASSDITIKADKSYFVYVGGLSVDSGQYSTVISCDREVAAVSNLSDPSSSASYSGVRGSEVADTLYAPGIYNNYYGVYSNVVVQNTTSSPITIRVRLYKPGQSSPFKTQKATDVPAYASATFDQTSLTQTGLFSAKIEATGEVAAVVNLWNNAGQLYSYNPFAAGSTAAYAPVLMKGYYGCDTALTVQNLSTGSTKVTVLYSNNSQTKKTIAGSSSALFYTPSEPASSLGSAKITTNNGAEIVALVNESCSNDNAATYSGFSEGSKTVNAPIVLKDYVGFSTSITCQNVGTKTTTIKVTYSNGVKEQQSAGKNKTALFYQPNVSGLPSGFNGSAVITAGQPIVCVVNEAGSSASAVDQLLAYNAIGQ